MKKVLLKSNGGFTLVESLISLSIGAMFLISVLSAWNYSTLIWKQENVQSGLRFHLESAMEKVKADVRLSDANKTLYYPVSSGGPYSAISVPEATRDSNGFFTLSSDITWNTTAIYHVYANNGEQELRKTVYDSFNSNDTARQTQLNNVVANGGDAGNATTRTIAKADTITFSINSSTPIFDGYNAATKLSANTDFGNVLLAPGTHQIKFLVTGKNAASSGYRMGIDSIALSPSGGSQETEALTYTSVSPTIMEDMSALGGWGGNYHVECQSPNGGSITFTTNYDQWLESNFANMTYPDPATAAVSGNNPYLTVKSREDQGLAPSWNITAQTQGADAVPAALSNKSIRCVISGASISKPATMIRIKFLAGSAPLTINSAYFGPRSGLTANYTGSPTQLYFNNGTVQEGGSDGVGAVGAIGPTIIPIPAGEHAWSNWFSYSVAKPSPTDFLVSMYVSAGNASAWTDIVTPTNTHSYQVDDDHAAVSDWTSFTPQQLSPTGYAVAEMAAWVSTGVATSQVYDTKMTSPNYSQLSWDPILPSGSSVSLKIRTSSNVTMSGASDWSTLTAYTSSPVSLGGLANLRYIQFQATLQAASPYASFPQLDNVKITWPGQTALVNVSGRFTKRPDYGTFQVLVDDVSLVKALTVNLTLSTAYKGKTVTEALGSEVKAKNTGR